VQAARTLEGAIDIASIIDIKSFAVFMMVSPLEFGHLFESDFNNVEHIQTDGVMPSNLLAFNPARLSCCAPTDI